MQKKRLFNLLSAMVIIVFIFSLFSTVNVLADDNTPPAPTEETAPPTETEEAAETESAPTSTPEAEVTEEATATEESTPEAESTDEPETVAEVLESTPEGVDVVVLDENGDALALATEEAATIILQGDPMWCPEGVTPGTDTLNECTPAYSDFASLVADLADGGYAGNGTIYVAYDYALSEGLIQIDHNNGSLEDLDDLTIQGGWNFGTNTMYNNDPAYQSTLDGTYLSIVNWVGDVTVNNIFIDNADSTGLYISTEGDVNIDQVNVNNSDLNGAFIDAEGDVTITNSDFTDNGYEGWQISANEYYAGDGLNVYADGDITLEYVNANYNGGDGAVLDSNANVFVTNSWFNDNGWATPWGASYSIYEYTDNVGIDYLEGGIGLDVDAEGDIEIDGIVVDGNSGTGAYLDAEGDVTVSHSDFINNGYLADYFSIGSYGDSYNYDSVNYESWYFYMEYDAGAGLDIYADGDVTLSALWVAGNAGDGAEIDAYGDVLVNDESTFEDNGWGGGFFGEGEGYDLLEHFLLDSGGDGVAFCENASGYETLVFPFLYNLCAPYSDGLGGSYLNIQGSNFNLNALMHTSDAGDLQASYSFDQNGGTGLDVDSYDASVTLNEVGVYANAGEGADIDGWTGVTITDSSFGHPEGGGNGFLGYRSFYECVGEGIQYCAYNNYEPVDFAYSIYFDLGYENGVHADSDNGSITISEVYVGGNAGDGALFHAYGENSSVFIENSTFEYNSAPLVVGGEDAPLGEFLYDMLGGFPGMELPVSELYAGVYMFDPSDPDDDSYLDAYIDFGSGTGLDVYGYDVTLNGVYVAENMGDGADLEVDHNLNIFDAGFYDNGWGFDGDLELDINFDGMDIFDPNSMYLDVDIENGSGLIGWVGNDITIESSAASYNALYGAYLENFADDSVFVTNSSFNNNGTGMSMSMYMFGNEYYSETYGEMYGGSGLRIYSDGNVTLTDVEASNNAIHGASINNDGFTFVENSVFYDNGYGAYGSWFYSYEDFVTPANSYSMGSEWYGSGLYVESDKTVNVTLLETIASGNYEHGVLHYGADGRLIICGGAYAGNGSGDSYGYGIYEDGASSLELYGLVDTSGNYDGDYYFSNSLIISPDGECPLPEETETETEFGSLCLNVEFATYLMSNGDFVVFPCPINDSAFVKSVGEDGLPAALPDFKPNEAGGEAIYRSALRTTLVRENEEIKENDRSMTVSFLIPAGVDTATLAILYWNGEEWIDLGGEVSDVGPDGEVVEGKQYFKVSTLFVGNFALVSK